MTDFYRSTATLTARQTCALGPRERQVLALVAAGDTNQQIAAKLALSPETVRTHLRRVFQKLGARNRHHAVAQAFRAGVLT